VCVCVGGGVAVGWGGGDKGGEEGEVIQPYLLAVVHTHHPLLFFCEVRQHVGACRGGSLTVSCEVGPGVGVDQGDDGGATNI
jgi:hypothetical protein